MRTIHENVFMFLVFIAGSLSLIGRHWRRSVQHWCCYVAFTKAAANIHRESLGWQGYAEEDIYNNKFGYDFYLKILTRG